MRNDNRTSVTPTRQVFWGVSLLVLALLSGCAATTPYRAHPQLEDRLRGGLRVAVMPPDVKVYEISIGEVREQMDEWSAVARQNVLAAINKRLTSGGGLTIRDFDPIVSEAAREEFEDARSLFQAVSLSVALHAYPTPAQFETKIDRFDYTLGPLPTLAQTSEADSLLFVFGVDHISSGGRVARDVATVLIGAAFGVIIVPQGGITTIGAVLVDLRTGDLLWFNKYSTAGVHDLRNPTSAEEFVAKALEGLTKPLPSAMPVKEKQQ